MSYLTQLGVRILPVAAFRKKALLMTTISIVLLTLVGTTAYASGLMAQLITLAAGETATIVCNGENLHIQSQSTQQIDVICEDHADPTPEPTATLEPEPTNTPEPQPTNTPEPEPTSIPPVPPTEFNPREIPIELQAWWTPAFGHIHAAAKLPLGQEVSGTMNFDVRIILHDNPSHLDRLRIDDDNGVKMKIPLDLRCATGQTCAFNVPVSLDTTQLKDGWRELRIRAETETVDGKRFLNSSGVPVLVNNGGSRSDYNRYCNNTSLIGRGWYEEFEYTNAIIECVPLKPVSGVHKFSVRAQKPSKHLTVALDKTHPIPAVGPWPEVFASPGTILFDEDGNFQKFFDVAVDTTQLSNGWHSLAVTSEGANGDVSQCDGCPNEESFPHGVAKIWFFVQN